jgi:hypothetical protein
MTYETLGHGSSAVEVTNVSRHGFWLLLNEKEVFLPFEKFPWFREAPIGKILHVELLSAQRLYWPELDVDLEVESILHPERFPLVSRVHEARAGYAAQSHDPRRIKRGGFCLLAGAAAFWLWASPAAAECYMDTPSGYQGMGGGGRIGPYPSRSACESVSSQYFGGQGSCSCTSSGSSGGGSDQRQWEEQQRRERERKRREFNEAEKRAEEQEEARRRQFEQNKQKALDLLKSGSNGLSLKGAGADGTGLKGTQPGELSLKEPLISKGSHGSAPPDLSGLDPKWPIVVDPKQVQGQTPQALRRANLTTHVLLDALAAGHGEWRESIRFLQDKLKDKPDDAHLIDALNLVRGYYNGYLGAKEVADNHYKYGVRQWLEGDFDGAARAFARAYRENPDDTLLFRSFAHTLGLRDGSGKCDAAFACSHIDIPRWPLVDELRIRESMESNLEEARLAVS